MINRLIAKKIEEEIRENFNLSGILEEQSLKSDKVKYKFATDSNRDEFITYERKLFSEEQMVWTYLVPSIAAQSIDFDDFKTTYQEWFGSEDYCELTEENFVGILDRIIKRTVERIKQEKLPLNF
jgi:hypothetical protein